MAKNKTDFSVRLLETRRARNLTQEQLGDIIDVEIATISAYETGRRRPSIDGLAELAKVLGVSADFLLGIDSTHLTSKPDYVTLPTSEIKRMNQALDQTEIVINRYKTMLKNIGGV